MAIVPCFVQNEVGRIRLLSTPTGQATPRVHNGLLGGPSIFNNYKPSCRSMMRRHARQSNAPRFTSSFTVRICVLFDVFALLPGGFVFIP
jgi:hypothetical protein